MAPLIKGNSLDDECTIAPISVSATQDPYTQFMVVPVAVIDDDALGYNSTAHDRQNTANMAGSDMMTIPRLVSTVQLVHVSTGRLLGTRTCLANDDQQCSMYQPVLLPR
jgi:hypothetical protein